VIRAVLDANTIISAMLVRGGLPARILDAAYAVAFLCFSGDAIVREVFRTLDSHRIRRKYSFDMTDMIRLRAFLQSDLVYTPITVDVRGVASHPEDDLILATAASAKADYLVTGDRQLLALGRYQGVEIVTPRAFATILGLPTSVQ
jgi:putative PIN family toxin of toxin-antitoxin system